MTDHHHDRSEALLDAFRAALTTTDAVPDEVVAAAKASFTWRTIDAELAELSYDSLLVGELAGTRGEAETRTLSFEFGAVGIEIEVETDGPSRRLVGQIAPGVPESIEVHHVSGGEPPRSRARSARQVLGHRGRARRRAPPAPLRTRGGTCDAADGMGDHLTSAIELADAATARPAIMIETER